MNQYTSAIRKAILQPFSVLFMLFAMCSVTANAQGTWTPLTNLAPDYNAGVMLLLADGSVMVKTSGGGNDGIGIRWDKLTPDIHGSYVNGTWTQLAEMVDSRLYYSSQVLRDGRVYVAGGEYGTGRAGCEIYNPRTDSWTSIPLINNLDTFSDANSELTPDGKVIQAIVYNALATYIFDPVTNTYSMGPNVQGSNNESAWVKLADNSILYVDVFSTNSERYIPATNTWVADATLPVGLYDPYGWETGAAFLLPDGRAFFIGSSSYTAYYNPTGNATPGVWTAGPSIPQSLGAPDAAAAMMVNGKILCAFSQTPDVNEVFYSPMKFFVFDYISNTFTSIPAPDGNDSLDAPCYYSNMLCLPDGSIMYASQGNDQYYVFKPTGVPLGAGKPIIDSIIKMNCDTFMATGKVFNGITEGACYGDDWQMATNYPIIRLMRHDTTFYTTTTNWNSTGVKRGTKKDTVTFMLPPGMPEGTYKLQVVANGNASDSFTFHTCSTAIVDTTDTTDTTTAVRYVPLYNKTVKVYPNPAKKLTTIAFNCALAGDYTLKLVDVYGKVVREVNEHAIAGDNAYVMKLDGIAKGMYTVTIRTGLDTYTTKLVIE